MPMPCTLFPFPGLELITYELTRYTDWVNELTGERFCAVWVSRNSEPANACTA